jgi:LPS-assembly lipoprotein
MSCIRRHRAAGRCAVLLLLAAAAAGLAGCGFRPLYGDGGGASARQLAQIEISRIPDRTGQRLRNLLIDRLTPEGEPSRPDFRLNVSVVESVAELAVRKDESATRASLSIRATFYLTYIGGKEELMHRGFASSINSYNRLTSDYATLAAEDDARERALRAIAEEIRLRIAAALQTPGAFRKPQPVIKPEPEPEIPPQPETGRFRR